MEAEMRLTSLDGIRDLRVFVASEMSACPSAMVHDLSLVASELASNAFVHADSDEVLVRLVLRVDSIDLCVSSRSEVPPSRRSRFVAAMMPGPTELRGRGLAIVAAIVDTHTITFDGHQRHDHVTISLQR